MAFGVYHALNTNCGLELSNTVWKTIGVVKGMCSVVVSKKVVAKKVLVR